VICRYTNLNKWRPLSVGSEPLGSKVHVYIGYIRINCIIAYQNKNHTFNWLNALHVTFIIPWYRLECWYRLVQKQCIDWYYWSRLVQKQCIDWYYWSIHRYLFVYVLINYNFTYNLILFLIISWTSFKQLLVNSI
jgi:hypothetical protein